jgi:hypothetical protein
MFSNPMFEWWLESLENRRQLSAVGAPLRPDASSTAPATGDAVANLTSPSGADGNTIITTSAEQPAGTFATGALPDAAPAPVETDDSAFVTDWFLAS